MTQAGTIFKPVMNHEFKSALVQKNRVRLAQNHGDLSHKSDKMQDRSAAYASPHGDRICGKSERSGTVVWAI